MSERKGIERNISVLTVMVVAISISFSILIVVSLWFKDSLIPSIIGVVPFLSLVYTITRHNYEKNLSSTRTSISINSCGNRAIITCTLKSLHPKRLFIDKANLFIDAGEMHDNIYRFKHILCHEYGEISCFIEKKMTSGDINSYQDINPGGKGIFFDLKHLSSATILYLDTNEEFNDDCVIQLEEGVYRAMFVTTFKNADCNCAIKHFIIDGDHKNIQTTPLHKKENESITINI